MFQKCERIGCRSRPGLTVILFFTVCLWLVIPLKPVQAHKVTIFAWVEGDTVHTQSKFSGGKRAKNSVVVVYDNEGNQLLEGKTDDNGEFSFKVPQKTELKVALKASMGHLAEWTIPLEEIAGTVDDSDQHTHSALDTQTESTSPAGSAVGVTREEVRTLIDASLDRKLAPIASMLADSMDSGPSVSEILGGIGYIFGLVGVAMYFSKRRNDR
jgi:nickel transport protein